MKVTHYSLRPMQSSWELPWSRRLVLLQTRSAQASTHRFRAMIRRHVSDAADCYRKSYDLACQSKDSSDIGDALFADSETREEKYLKVVSQLERIINCRPAGFLTRPVSYTCRDRFVCPWCFVRERFAPIRRIIDMINSTNFEFEVRVWTQPIGDVPRKNWFSSPRGHGLHGSTDAWATVQTLVYDYLPQYGTTGLRKIVLQLLPVMAGRNSEHKIPANAEYYRAYSRDRLTVDANVERLFLVNWTELLTEEFVPNYVFYRQLCDRTRFMRISMLPVLRALLKDNADVDSPTSEAESTLNDDWDD